MNAATGALSTVANFTGTAGVAPGSAPAAGLVSDGSGFFWGTTQSGGIADGGTVFKITISSGR